MYYLVVTFRVTIDWSTLEITKSTHPWREYPFGVEVIFEGSLFLVYLRLHNNADTVHTEHQHLRDTLSTSLCRQLIVVGIHPSTK